MVLAGAGGNTKISDISGAVRVPRKLGIQRFQSLLCVHSIAMMCAKHPNFFALARKL